MCIICQYCTIKTYAQCIKVPKQNNVHSCKYDYAIYILVISLTNNMFWDTHQISFLETSFDKKQVLNNPTPKHTPQTQRTAEICNNWRCTALRARSLTIFGEVFSTVPQKSDFSKKPTEIPQNLHIYNIYIYALFDPGSTLKPSSLHK